MYTNVDPKHFGRGRIPLPKRGESEKERIERELAQLSENLKQLVERRETLIRRLAEVE